MNKIIFCFLIIVLAFASCDKSTDQSFEDHKQINADSLDYSKDSITSPRLEDPKTNCFSALEIDRDLYSQRAALDSLLFIDLVSIELGCLKLNIGYSGCNNGHNISLVTTGDILESQPPQIRLRFIDHTKQLCLAAFLDNTSFDLSPIEETLSFEGPIRLIFPDAGTEILWERN